LNFNLQKEEIGIEAFPSGTARSVLDVDSVRLWSVKRLSVTLDEVFLLEEMVFGSGY
jgi:hypothetical protein